MKTEYEKQIRTADKKIAELKTQRDQLLEQFNHLKIDQLGVGNQILKQKNEIDVMIHAAEVMRQAAQDQVSRWQKNEPEATRLIEEIKKIHEHARGIYTRYPKIQQEVIGLDKDLAKDNTAMGAGEQKFRDLTGEDLNLPFPIVCYPAQAFAAAQPIKTDAYPPWTYVSETQRRAAYAEELEKKLKAHEDRIKIAEQYAPNCVACARGNVETKLVVDRRSGHSDSPGQAGKGSMSHHWNLVCPKCHTTTTAPIAETKK